MAGILQEGLCFASIPVTIFDNDARIDRLLDAQGWRGVGVYMYLLLRAYGGRGYYTEWRFADCATTARKMGGGLGAKNVEEAMRCCTQVGLWDKMLLEEWGILTSVDVQQNYLIAAKKARRKVRIVSEYWLLEEMPPLNSLVSCTKKENECNKNADKCSNDENKCNKDDPSMICIYDMYSTTTTITDKLVSKGGRTSEHDSQSLLLSSAEMAERKDKYGPAIAKWESVTAQPLSEHELTTVCGLVDCYGEQWVLDAIGISGDAGKPNLRYTKAILNNWQVEGRNSPSRGQDTLYRGRDAKKPAAKRDDDMSLEELKATFM